MLVRDDMSAEAELEWLERARCAAPTGYADGAGCCQFNPPQPAVELSAVAGTSSTVIKGK